MILELGDGRELHLPDDMDDEHARQMKAFILATEERARNAERDVQALRGEMVAMRNEFVSAMQQSTLTADALKDLRETFAQGMADLRAVAGADREIIDETGERIRSRVVKV